MTKILDVIKIHQEEVKINEPIVAKPPVVEPEIPTVKVEALKANEELTKFNLFNKLNNIQTGLPKETNIFNNIQTQFVTDIKLNAPLKLPVETPPLTLTGEEETAVQASAERVKNEGKYDPQKGANALTDEIAKLKAKYGDEAAAEFIKELNKRDKKGEVNLTNILKFASHQSAKNPEKLKLLGDAVGNAYNSMSPEEKTEFIKKLTQQVEADGFTGRHLDPNREPTFIADLIAAGSNNNLKKDFVNSLVKRGSEIDPKLFGNNGGVDVQNLYLSAAKIAGSGDKASQVEMFKSIIKSFPDLADQKDQLKSVFGNKAFKETMGQIFINNSKDILASLTSENGRFKDSKSLDGLVKFLELSVFSKDGGSNRDQVKGEIIKIMSQFANGEGGLGRTGTADSYMAGSLLGALQSAAINQKDAIKADQQARAETAKFFTGVAFSFVPGASKVLGEGSEKVLEVAYNKAKEYAQQQSGSALAGFINNMADGNAIGDIKKLYTELRDLNFKITSELPENLANAFGNGYTETGVDQLFSKALNE